MHIDASVFFTAKHEKRWEAYPQVKCEFEALMMDWIECIKATGTIAPDLLRSGYVKLQMEGVKSLALHELNKVGIRFRSSLEDFILNIEKDNKPTRGLLHVRMESSIYKDIGKYGDLVRSLPGADVCSILAGMENSTHRCELANAIVYDIDSNKKGLQLLRLLTDPNAPKVEISQQYDLECLPFILHAFIECGCPNHQQLKDIVAKITSLSFNSGKSIYSIITQAFEEKFESPHDHEREFYLALDLFPAQIFDSYKATANIHSDSWHNTLFINYAFEHYQKLNNKQHRDFNESAGWEPNSYKTLIFGSPKTTDDEKYSIWLGEFRYDTLFQANGIDKVAEEYAKAKKPFADFSKIVCEAYVNASFTEAIPRYTEDDWSETSMELNFFFLDKSARSQLIKCLNQLSRDEIKHPRAQQNMVAVCELFDIKASELNSNLMKKQKLSMDLGI